MNLKSHKCTGRVVHGRGRGRALGYPTANVALDHSIPEGIYVGYVTVADQRYSAAIFVGSSQEIEAHLLDFAGDIYGQVITIDVLKQIRANQIFTSDQKLIKQIEQDIKVIRLCLQALAKQS